MFNSFRYFMFVFIWRLVRAPGYCKNLSIHFSAPEGESSSFSDPKSENYLVNLSPQGVIPLRAHPNHPPPHTGEGDWGVRNMDKWQINYHFSTTTFDISHPPGEPIRWVGAGIRYFSASTGYKYNRKEFFIQTLKGFSLLIVYFHCLIN